ncbi:hypothetical protein Aglo01_47690 [Actinokineospora globicatena]|nr:hypothetical protein Aglo01_47690 [Actinokineospora globicatena]
MHPHRHTFERTPLTPPGAHPKPGPAPTHSGGGGVPGPVYRDPLTVDLEPTHAEIDMWITSVTQKRDFRAAPAANCQVRAPQRARKTPIASSAGTARGRRR